MQIFLWVWGGGGGGRIFNLLHDLLYELINSINIHLLCFIYLFIYYYYCKLSHIRVCGFLVFVSVCSFGVACVCGFMLFHCFARLDHLVNIQSKHLLVKLTSQTKLYGLVLINLIVLVFEMKLGAKVVIWNGGIYSGLTWPFPNIHLLVGQLFLVSFQPKLEFCNRVFQVPVNGLCVFCSSGI